MKEIESINNCPMRLTTLMGEIHTLGAKRLGQTRAPQNGHAQTCLPGFRRTVRQGHADKLHICSTKPRMVTAINHSLIDDNDDDICS